MTEKRFAISSDNNQNIYDTEEKCYYSSIDAKKLCDLLNDLSEENEQLKIRFNEEREKSLKFCRNIDTLTIENEKLKHEIEDLNDILARYEEKELQRND